MITIYLTCSWEFYPSLQLLGYFQQQLCQQWLVNLVFQLGWPRSQLLMEMVVLLFIKKTERLVYTCLLLQIFCFTRFFQIFNTQHHNEKDTGLTLVTTTTATKFKANCCLIFGLCGLIMCDFQLPKSDYSVYQNLSIWFYIHSFSCSPSTTSALPSAIRTLITLPEVPMKRTLISPSPHLLPILLSPIFSSLVKLGTLIDVVYGLVQCTSGISSQDC